MFQSERIIRNAEHEIDIIENDDSLTAKERAQQIKDVEREARELMRDEWNYEEQW